MKKTFEELEKEWKASLVNRDKKEEEFNLAKNDFMNSEKYERWVKIATKIYIWGDFDNHWRLSYKTFDEALEEERKAFYEVIESKEYNALKEIREVFHEATAMEGKIWMTYYKLKNEIAASEGRNLKNI